MNRHLILVGLPGSGKTTAGRLAAKLLRTAFSDTDQIVSDTTRLSIPEVFTRYGEHEFRRLERAAMDGALAAPPHVISPGGGWMSQPGNLEAAAGALIVYLEISPEDAARRLGDAAFRPLLSGDPLPKLRTLLAEREPWYAKAQARVSASGSPNAVAAELARLSSSHGKP